MFSFKKHFLFGFVHDILQYHAKCAANKFLSALEQFSGRKGFIGSWAIIKAAKQASAENPSIQ